MEISKKLKSENPNAVNVGEKLNSTNTNICGYIGEKHWLDLTSDDIGVKLRDSFAVSSERRSLTPIASYFFVSSF